MKNQACATVLPDDAAGTAVAAAQRLIAEFWQHLGKQFPLEASHLTEIANLLDVVGTENIVPPRERAKAFEYCAARKLKVNDDKIKTFIDECARAKVIFNYYEKMEIAEAFDRSDEKVIMALLDRRSARHMGRIFSPATPSEIQKTLDVELQSTLNRRTKEREEHRVTDLVLSLLGAFIYGCLIERSVHQANDPIPEGEYEPFYWDRLTKHQGHLFARDAALTIRIVTSADDGPSLSRKKANIRVWIAQQFDRLNNHGFMALVIEPDVKDGWAIAEDAMLFSERLQATGSAPAFHRGEAVLKELLASTEIGPESKTSATALYEGFLYKDCFISVEQDKSARLVLIFQKNVRDQTVLPCPACRSHNVRSNSYPSLGVRSWECANWICPDRSRSNRGKRFAFWSLLCQQGLVDGRNLISREHVRRWARDIVAGASLDECLEMLIRHYSLCDDGVQVFASDFAHLPPSAFQLERAVSLHGVSGGAITGATNTAISNFRSLYHVETRAQQSGPAKLFYADEMMRVYNGLSEDVLFSLPSNSIDGAVTSPPYYNAREYSQWANIYTHMSSMRGVAKGVFRCLRPGSFYLYNVFDYFDNDNTITTSAMGKRRIILSAYTVDIFSEIGFELVTNIAWDKGEIEGKRAFNGGNYTPFYQAPFNCWEHILVFQKPGHSKATDWPAVWQCPPVKKMFRGENRHGHTAPYPDALPELLIQRLGAGDVVLDPFAGSLTTGRVAYRHGVKSICVEQDANYCQLGLDMLQAELAHPSLL